MNVPKDLTVEILKSIRDETRGLRQEMREGLQSVRAEMRDGMESLRAEVHDTNVRLESTHRYVTGVELRLATLITDFVHDIRRLADARDVVPRLEKCEADIRDLQSRAR